MVPSFSASTANEGTSTYDCPYQWNFVNSETACKNAAKGMAKEYATSGQDAGWPAGCFLYTPNDKLYYNNGHANYFTTHHIRVCTSSMVTSFSASTANEGTSTYVLPFTVNQNFFFNINSQANYFRQDHIRVCTSMLVYERVGGCHLITTEAECVAAKDSRPHWLDQPCTWCCGSSCLPGTNSERCQPHTWLMGRSDYSGKGKNGAGYNTCPVQHMPSSPPPPSPSPPPPSPSPPPPSLSPPPLYQQGFHLALAGAVSCDYGLPATATFAQCQAAVDDLTAAYGRKRARTLQFGGNNLPMACKDGSWGDVPQGCSAVTGAQTTGDWAAHYKSSGANCNNGNYQLVCSDVSYFAISSANVLTSKYDCPNFAPNFVTTEAACRSA
eukprot:CAMPEP_0119343314 /NCGR_PEP_ID=MMETSP1333-20130426/106378_1 /TAXON_ID=418940 /ORGANISM="Scyphosphaera apsteinii, Strain RCC1455" /LENGTH=382 /DNA_ID=CAMNT_0007355697 /DNA_START=708 /DNA_END=1854 /DNA_ORIENTATION=-